MAQRADLTLILITRQSLVRADFAHGSPPSAVNFWTQPRPDLPDLAAQVEAAPAPGPKPARQVWVLSSDVWAQTLVLPAARASGLSTGELAEALNFEAEGLSGQSAFDSSVGHTLLKSSGSEKAFWLVQVRNADLAALDDVVRLAGSRLAGVAHPAGVPLPVVAPRGLNAPWQRAELWPDAVVYVQGQADRPADVQVNNVAPQTGRWQVEWEQWRGGRAGGNHEELLLDAGALVAQPSPPSGIKQAGNPSHEGTGPALVRLDDEASLRSWLRAWAAVLGKKNPPVPVVQLPRRPMTVGQSRAAAAVLALVAALACAAHFVWLDVSFDAIQEQVKDVRKPAEDLASANKLYKELEARRTDLKKQQDKLAAQSDLLHLQRHRLARLLTGLQEHFAEHLFVEKIESDRGDPRICGVCLRPELADQFANRLANALPVQGWSVGPAKKKALHLTQNGGPWTFEIQFQAFDGALAQPSAAAGKGDRIGSP